MFFYLVFLPELAKLKLTCSVWFLKLSRATFEKYLINNQNSKISLMLAISIKNIRAIS